MDMLQQRGFRDQAVKSTAGQGKERKKMGGGRRWRCPDFLRRKESIPIFSLLDIDNRSPFLGRLTSLIIALEQVSSVHPHVSNSAKRIRRNREQGWE